MKKHTLFQIYPNRSSHIHVYVCVHRRITYRSGRSGRREGRGGWTSGGSCDLTYRKLALWLDRPWTLAPSATATAAVIWLGIGPTALATILYFMLIRSAGTTFMSLVNYMSPCIAVFLGLALMGEHQQTNAYWGLALILAGIAVTQRRRASQGT